jgi:hypothetical protein
MPWCRHLLEPGEKRIDRVFADGVNRSPPFHTLNIYKVAENYLATLKSNTDTSTGRGAFADVILYLVDSRFDSLTCEQ